MRIALLVALCASETPPPVLAVVRTAVPGVSLTEGGVTARARPAALLGAEASLETGRGGWAEIDLVGVGLVRLSADTRVVLTGDRRAVRVSIVHGRAWLERHSRRESGTALEVALSSHIIRAEERASLVVERTHLSGLLSVLSGSARVGEGAAEVSVGAARVVKLVLGEAPTAPEVASGGTLPLLRLEERERLGDPGGFEAFVLARARAAPIARAKPRELAEPHRGSLRVMGGDAGPAGLLVEESLRVAPFLESEVPPKGPNVEVEVVFDD